MVDGLLTGAVVGAVTAEVLKRLIAEAKKAKAFKSLFKDLESNIMILIPLIKDTDRSVYEQCLGAEVLKELEKTILGAYVLLLKCRDVKSCYRKAKYARKISKVNEDINKFIQMHLQLSQLKYQLQSMEAIKKSLQILSEKVDQH